MRARWLLPLAVAGCVSQPDRIYHHEMRAEAYEARGMYDAAAEERVRAERERENLSRHEHTIFARDDR